MVHLGIVLKYTGGGFPPLKNADKMYMPFYGLLPVCPARPLTSDINEAFSSTQLLLTGHFLFLEPLPVKPRDGCDDVNIPVYIYLQLVKCSDCQWSTSITMFTTFKITFVPFRHPPPLHELLLLQVVLTTSTCLNALGCCRVVMFVCFFLTLDSSRGKEGNAPVNHNLYCQHRTVHRANCDSRAMTSRVGDGSPVTGWVMPSHRIDKG